MIYHWSKQQLTKHIRRLAEDSCAVVLTEHSIQRMKQRKISMALVMQCLRYGQIRRQPEPNLRYGTLECRMEYHIAGETLGVVVALVRQDPNLIVVTVMHIHER